MAKINQYPAKTVPSNNDEFVLHDPSSGSTKKMTRGDLIGGAPLPAKSVTLPAINGGSTAGVLTTDASGDVSVKSPKIGLIGTSVLGTNGVKPITVGFKPSLVRFTLITTISAGNSYTGVGAMDSNGIQFATGTYGSGSENTRNGATNICICSVGGGGNFMLTARYTSMDTNGFSIEVTKADANFSVMYEAYP